MFSLRPSYVHHGQPYPRTNEHILTRTALHLGSETLKLFLCIFSLPRSIIRQHSLFPCTLTPEHTFTSHTEHPTTTLSVDLYLHYGDQVYTARLFGFLTLFSHPLLPKGLQVASSSPLSEAPRPPSRTPSRDRSCKRGSYDPSTHPGRRAVSGPRHPKARPLRHHARRE